MAQVRCKALKSPKNLRGVGQSTGFYGLLEGRMVRFGLFGIGVGERSDRLVQDGALAQIGGQDDRVGGAGVGPGQNLAAGLGIAAEMLGHHGLELRLDLGVAQLADIELAPGRAIADSPARYRWRPAANAGRGPPVRRGAGRASCRRGPPGPSAWPP